MPLAFVLSALVGIALAVWLEPVAYVLVAELGLYLAAAIFFGARSLRRRGEPLALLPRVVGAYLAFHVGYGAGMLRGLIG